VVWQSGRENTVVQLSDKTDAMNLREMNYSCKFKLVERRILVTE